MQMCAKYLVSFFPPCLPPFFVPSLSSSFPPFLSLFETGSHYASLVSLEHVTQTRLASKLTEIYLPLHLEC